MSRLLTLLLLVLGLLPASLRAAEQVVVLGDSLSKEYEFSFRLDGFEDPDSVRNWIEILDDLRNPHFDLGSRRDVDLFFFEIFFRHQYNWAVPGSRIEQISQFLRGEIEFLDFFAGGDANTFESIVQAIAAFLTRDDFDVADLDRQLRESAERVVLLVGGNDIDEVYREIYEADPGFDSSAWIGNFVSEAEFIVDWVLARNPQIEFVVASLPHVGITPTVKASHPTDPVKTARVTSVLRELNKRLAALARDRGIAFADLFEPTLRLLDPGPLCIHGVPFQNDVPPSGQDPGDLDYVWLNGTASDGFHPNTNAQAMLANEIVRAFQERYNLPTAPLGASEILQDLLGKDPDVSFPVWATCHGLANAGPTDDRDGDGLPLALEFGVGADPNRHDPWLVRFTARPEGLELSYPIRLPGTAAVSVRPAVSDDLAAWQLLPGEFSPGPDGRVRALLPFRTSPAFLRLEALLPP